MNANEKQTLVDEQEIEELRQSLPKAYLMGSKAEMLNYQGFWCRTMRLKDLIYYQRHFRAQDSDIMICSLPKAGTNWLKTLLFSIVNRFNVDHQPLNKKSPLLTQNIQQLVYHLDNDVYAYHPNLPSPDQLEDLPSPRLMNTHFPYPTLPDSIKDSACKILYIARNPLDTFVSHWHWHTKTMKNVGLDPEFRFPSIQEFFEDFCQGKFPYGPYFEHVLGYWKQSVEQSNKVLFLKYEDLKGDNAMFHLKNMAEFIGLPFSPEEESNGVINDIIELCSIDNLKELEINKTGFWIKAIEKKDFFRKGEVGDWTNHCSPSMVEKMKTLMEQKLGGTGLSFQLLLQE